MNKGQRPAPFLIADDPALDFLNSVAAPQGTEIEWLADGQDLLAWLEHAELVTPKTLAKFRKKKFQPECDQASARARKLREWFRKFVTQHVTCRADSADRLSLSEINRLLRSDDSHRQIEWAKDPDSRWHWTLHRNWESPQMLLVPIAEALGEFLVRGEFKNANQCEGANCTLWFRDTTRNHTRRWCSMEICGNRAKAAGHRARRKSERNS